MGSFLSLQAPAVHIDLNSVTFIQLDYLVKLYGLIWTWNLNIDMDDIFHIDARRKSHYQVPPVGLHWPWTFSHIFLHF